MAKKKSKTQHMEPTIAGLQKELKQQAARFRKAIKRRRNDFEKQYRGWEKLLDLLDRVATENLASPTRAQKSFDKALDKAIESEIVSKVRKAGKKVKPSKAFVADKE
jgi:imidazolonepropionase-like amidohydrolase